MSPRLARTLAASLALAAALALSQGAEARFRHGGPHHGRSPGGLVARHAERLGLDEATLETIQRIVEESGVRNEDLHEEIRAARKAMRSLLSASNPDADAIMEQAEIIGSLETQAHKNRIRTIMQIRSHLTPEQRDELVRIREEKFSQRRRGRLGRCTKDLRTLCSEADPGLGTLSCLRDRWAELSEPCRAVFESVPDAPRAAPR